jgi:hypothetical protein
MGLSPGSASFRGPVEALRRQEQAPGPRVLNRGCRVARDAQQLPAGRKQQVVVYFHDAWRFRGNLPGAIFGRLGIHKAA